MKFKLVEGVDNLLLEKLWVGLRFKDNNTNTYFNVVDPDSELNRSSDIIYFYSTNDTNKDVQELNAYFTSRKGFSKQTLNRELKKHLFNFYKKCKNNVEIEVLGTPVTPKDLQQQCRVLTKSDRDLRGHNTNYANDNVLQNSTLDIDKFLIHHPDKHERENNNIWIIPYPDGNLDAARAAHILIENNKDANCDFNFEIYHFEKGEDDKMHKTNTKKVRLSITDGVNTNDEHK